MRAFAYTTGEIGFGQRLPKSNMALPIAKAPARILRQAIQGSARKAYDGKTWLVPGVPEADDEIAKVDAVTAYRRRVERRIEQLSRELQEAA